MKLESITITAEASKAYQKYCASFTATDLNNGDLETLRNLAIMESIKGINLLANETSDKAEVKVTVNRDEVKKTVSKVPSKPSYYSKPKSTVPPVPTASKYQDMNVKDPEIGEIRIINSQPYKYSYSEKNDDYYWYNTGMISESAPKYWKEK